MSYPGTPPPGSPADRTATLVTSVIGAIALIAVLLIAVITSDSAASALGQQVAGGGTGDSDSGGSAVSGGGSVSSEGGSSSTVSIVPAPTPTPVTPPSVTASPPAPSLSTTPRSSTTSASPHASQLRATFPTPPHTTKVKSYASLPKPKDEDWYVSTSSLATVHTFYLNLFKKSGWHVYIKPSVYKDSSGKIDGYFSIYHLREQVTAELSVDRNYLDEKPGTVLIRSGISDD